MRPDAQGLMSIGRFSEQTTLTVKALRLYDKTGLLRPAVVDMDSGYRYYSPDQAETAVLIKLLRSADMPLQDIRQILDADDTSAARAHLMRHRERIEARIGAQRESLDLLQAIDSRYERMEKERTMREEKPAYQCSFCGRSAAEVRRMIAGPNRVYICNECVDLCNQIIAKEEAQPPTKV